MGTINFVVLYIIFIDHVMYILAENKAGKDVVVGHGLRFSCYILFINLVAYVLAENKAAKGLA
jgi:uncharacterized membrane protein